MTSSETLRNRVWEGELPKVAWYVHQVLKSAVNKASGSCTMSLMTIQLMISIQGKNYGVRQIRRGVRTLEAAGYLDTYELERVRPGSRRGCGQAANLYVFRDTDGAAPAPELPPQIKERGRLRRLCPGPPDFLYRPPIGTLEAKTENASSPLSPSPQAETGIHRKPAPTAPDNGIDPPPGDSRLPELIALYQAAGELGKKAAPLAAGTLEALEWLLGAFDFPRAKAVVRIFLGLPRWNGWSGDMLKNAVVIDQIMRCPEFSGVYRKYRDEWTASAMRSLRSGRAGALIAAVLTPARPPDSS